MDDYLQEYYGLLVEHIKASSDVDGHAIEFEFLSHVLGLLCDASEFDEYCIVEDGRDGAGRWLIDGYCFDTSNSTLLLFGTLISSTNEEIIVLTRREVESVLKKLINFLKKALTETLSSIFEPSSNCYQAAKLILDNWGDISHVRFLILSNRPASERMREISIEDIDNRSCTVHLWDLRRIFELESSRNEREDVVIDLRDEPLPCLIVHNQMQGTQSILTVMSGSRLVSLYGRWGSRLLEQNVRSFLQHKGKVNKGIKSTILHEPTHFFAYNNGLTTIAQEVIIEDTNMGPVIVELRNLQIVNGGQTTASIYSAYSKDKADLSQISVQMKLTVVSEDESTNLIPKISRYANSQNKVSDADLFSNHPFHVRLEELAGRLMIPAKLGQSHGTYWFYERARGQYLNAQLYLSPAEKRKFQLLKPRTQLLTKTDIAKIMNSWDCLPHEVSKGAQKNFAKFAELVNTQWEKDNLTFNELYFRILICRASIFRELEKKIMKEQWYIDNKGYRANLVTYAIAKLSYEINKKSLDWNVDSLWRALIVPDSIMKLLCQLSQNIHSLLLSNDRPVVNPSEYAKREMFWSLIKNSLDCDIGEIEDFLVSRTESDQLILKSKKTQQIDNGIRLQEKVLKMPKEIWVKVEQFLFEDDAATPSLIGILEVAKSIKKIPTEKQSAVLVKLLDRYADKLPNKVINV